jgi:arylsulfatase A-like enzyme
MEAQGHFASAQYRGYKTDIWEGGHRMPFFVRWPGVVRPESRSDALIGLGDFMATAAALLGVTLPETAAPDSVSFFPVLRNPASPVVRTDLVHHSQLGTFSIRVGSWKLILGAGSGGAGQPTDSEAASLGVPDAQLYNLATDPGETTNRIATHRAEAARLAALLRRHVENGRSTPGPAQANDVAVMLPASTSLASPPIR